MELWQIITALIQGLAEWLPISSQGMVILFTQNLGAAPADSLLALSFWLHLGTMSAVIVRYPREIVHVLTLKDKTLFWLLLIATVGTALTALPLYYALKIGVLALSGELLNVLVGLLLLLTGVVLYVTSHRTLVIGNAVTDHELSNRESFMTGLVQGFSVLPGLSRSGVTVSTLLMQKVEKETAFRFSFLMSVPAVVGILCLELLGEGVTFGGVSPVDLIGMEIIVFLTGLASMEALLRLARRVSFWKLCVVLALVAITFGMLALL
ncbi:MAG: hypothetical protein C4K49_08670 [Candidatus Thorarchaeota archaeon]|nr:MAG: hypothetical protein C4K49_08670 [Candidatus Thorarchaeota archaeon]